MAKKTTSKKAKTTAKPAAKSERKNAPSKQAAAPSAPEPKAPASRPRDPRLPAPGTVLEKRDRQGKVRCECTVEEDGIHYAGKTFRSLSAAAMAASKDLGLGGRAQNGYLFWGLVKQPARAGDLVAVLGKAWERYHGRVQALAANASPEAHETVRVELKKHAEALADLARAV